MKKSNSLLLGLVVATGFTATHVSAAITGQVDVKLNVSSGCTVNNVNSEGSVNKFGTLDFGRTASTWNNILTGEVAGSGNGGEISVKCDTGVSAFNVSIDGGEKGDRQLTNGTDNVKYNVYQDSARSTEYAINTPVPFTVDGEVKIPVYGAIAKNTGGKGVSEGDYKDTLLVTVTF